MLSQRGRGAEAAAAGAQERRDQRSEGDTLQSPLGLLVSWPLITRLTRCQHLHLYSGVSSVITPPFLMMLAAPFLFLLHFLLLLLLPGTACGDLSDNDKGYIASLLFDFEARMNEKLDDVRHDVNATRIEAIHSEGRVMRAIKRGFQGVHSFGRRRVAALEGVSSEIIFACNTSARLTSHALFRNNRVAIVVTPHVICPDNILASFDPTFSGKALLHPVYDFALLNDCNASSIKAALNVTSYAKPKLGDSLSAYGFGEVASVWEGILSRVATPRVEHENCTAVLARHWAGNNRICSGELVAQGHQHEGMSGAAVLNSCGYVGVAHAITNNKANFAFIVPASAIVAFFDKHAHSLPTLQQCGMRVEEPPLAEFVCHEPSQGVCTASSCP